MSINKYLKEYYTKYTNFEIIDRNNKKDMVVIYFSSNGLYTLNNTDSFIKEIINNTFGTKTPVLFQDWAHPIPNRMTGSINPMSVKVKCFGKYTFKITNPALFMSKIAGISDIYIKPKGTKDYDLDFETLKNIFKHRLSNYIIYPSAMPTPCFANAELR